MSGFESCSKGCLMSDPPILVLLLGFFLGISLGAAARWTQFCTLGAIADAVIIGDQRRLRAWGLAIAVSITGTQLLHMAGIVDIGQSIYLSQNFNWLGAVLGGLMFGVGMALVGTCGFGTLIRLGGGDLRALVDLATLGFFAYLTLSGPLAYVRTFLIEPTSLALPGLQHAGLPEFITYLSGLADASTRPLVMLLSAAALLIFCFRSRPFRSCYRQILVAVIIGLVVTTAWLTTGAIGYDEFDPRPPVSFTFVRPLGESMLYLMLMSGMALNFGIASVAGVLVGAHLVARVKSEWHREGFDGDREMIRHFAGSAMMGTGGVMALGCTIGQGISGISTLSLSAPLALLAIFIGAAFGLRYLEEGNIIAAARVFTGRARS